jgi:hypothetical protein
MLESRGNILDLVGRVDAVCITTNGFIKKNGEAVMGKGCAKAAAERWPQLPAILGNLITEHGNRVFRLLTVDRTEILSYPVKRIRRTMEEETEIPLLVVRHMQNKFKVGSVVPGWALKAELPIIIRSAAQVLEIADRESWNQIILPRPGSGAGELEWQNHVKQALDIRLDDRFTSYTF